MLWQGLAGLGMSPVRRGLAVVVRCVPVGSGWFRQAMLCLASVCFGEAVEVRQVWSRRVSVRSGLVRQFS